MKELKLTRLRYITTKWETKGIRLVSGYYMDGGCFKANGLYNVIPKYDVHETFSDALARVTVKRRQRVENLKAKIDYLNSMKFVEPLD